MYSTYTPYGMITKQQNCYLQNQMFAKEHKSNSPGNTNGITVYKQQKTIEFSMLLSLNYK